MNIALNICDLDSISRESRLIVPILLREFCDEASPVTRNQKQQIDDAAIILDGPASHDTERVISLVDLLQTSIGPRKIGRRVRCYYQNRAGNWTEIRPGTDWAKKATSASQALYDKASAPQQLALF
jgi:hypothetical protein